MFEENIEIIKNTFGEFKGSGMYMILFFISIIYILIKEDNKKVKAFLIYFSIIILLITLNPIFNKLVGKILTDSVYWRVYWMLPLGTVIAYAGVKFINNSNGKIKKVISTVAIIIVIIISGKLIYNKDNYKKINNLYKVPDEVLEVVEIIRQGDEENKKALTSEQLVPYIRQVEPSIELAYRREPTGYLENEYVRIMHSGISKDIVQMAFDNDCNYIVLDRGLVINVELHYFGFERIAETANFIIYRVMNSNWKMFNKVL